MSGCDVCLGTDDFDFTWDFYEAKSPIARKEHVCCECGEKIPIGAKYENVSARGDGEFFAYKTCLICVELRNAFTCQDGYSIPHDLLWEEIREYLFPNMTTGCLQKVQSAAAKDFLVKRWNAWKFRAAPAPEEPSR